MQVPEPMQHKVMIEAVENHMPEVIIVDEIDAEAEALACRSIAKRVVMLIGTAPGERLENMIKIPILSDLGFVEFEFSRFAEQLNSSFVVNLPVRLLFFTSSCSTEVRCPALRASGNFLKPILHISAFAKELRCLATCCTRAENKIYWIEEKKGETLFENQRRKLFVLNLPWSLTASDIKDLFNQCGTVTDVEIIKQKDGKSRGLAFVTMSSAEDAQEQSIRTCGNMQEVSGRIIRVEFAKRFKTPSPPPPERPISGETRHKLYVSNLAWKAMSNNLRELFRTSFKPVSTRVVFDSPSGRSAGYGFVSFATKEEAEAALSALDGKVGGTETVTLEDGEARARSQKSVLEREGPPTFAFAIEMWERHYWVAHRTERSVDTLLHGKNPLVEGLDWIQSCDH
ncbi:RNA recognition motif domain [Dillenia turbinata]|uniref:RNA recognition motif domain n=1 Tax=Dillenia turbinata TaxID=194707 RepID=A0AAN8ZNJ0_9MAGN